MDSELAIEKLQRMEQIDRDLRVAEDELERAKAAQKVAKDAVEMLQGQLLEVLRRKPNPLPLFDSKAKEETTSANGHDWRDVTIGDTELSAKTRAKLADANLLTLGAIVDYPQGMDALPGITPAEADRISKVLFNAQATAEVSRQLLARPSASEDDEAWKAEPIASLMLPVKSINEPLAAVGITTLGQLAAWTEPEPSGYCKQLADIPNIDKGRAAKIEEASLRFFERRCQNRAQEATA